MKILIISHNSFSTSGNMGKTFLSLFSQFKKNELCQLYIHNTFPDVKKCNSYYRITDKDALKGVYTFKVRGKEIQDYEIHEGNLVKNMYKFKNKNSFFKKVARDIIWNMSPWSNNELKEWLERENPTHIFVAPGPNIFFYKIVLKIIKELNIPVYTYICDDYYLCGKPKFFLDRIYHKKLIKKAENIIKKSEKIITICDELSKKYEDYFDISCQTIMTGIDMKDEKKDVKPNKLKTFSFMGNISYDRYKSLWEIGNVIDKINKQEDKNIVLNIYANINNPDVAKLLKSCNSISLHNFVYGDEYVNAKNNTDVFIHTESFNKECINFVRNSISTKIPECLSSGKILLAYGPKEVASISYLKKNSCGIVITEKNELKKEILKLVNMEYNIQSIVEKEIETARLYHDNKKNSTLLYEIFNQINVLNNERGFL